MLDTVRHIVSLVCNYPDQVAVEEAKAKSEMTGDDILLYCIRVSPADVARVIGREGRMVRSMETLLNGASLKSGGKPLLLKIVQPERRTHGTRARP